MSAVKRIAVLVSGGGTNLQALIDAQEQGDIISGRIAAVILFRILTYRVNFSFCFP